LQLDRTEFFYKLAGTLYNAANPIMNEQEIQNLPQNEMDNEDLDDLDD
jgi:hypothetical protein